MQSFLSVHRAASSVFIPVAIILACALFVVSPDGAAAQSSATVGMVDNQFDPSTVTVSAGATITWVNNGANNHTATGSGFDTGQVAPGASASVTLDTAGTYDYICSVHGASMSGSIVVMAAEGGGDDDAADDDSSTAETTQVPATGTGSAVSQSVVGPLAIGAIGGMLLIFGAAARKRIA